MKKFKLILQQIISLNRQGRSLRSDLQNEINQFVEESRNSEQIDLNKIKEKLDDLYTRYKQQFTQVEYQIASTDIMSVSELSYKKKTLPTGFVRLGNKKAIIHTQVKGNINYIYNEDEERMDKISTSYYY